MPVISMTLGSGQIDDRQKEAFIEKITQSAAEITGISDQSFIVVIDEKPTDNIGLGGRSLTRKRQERLQTT